MLLRPTVYVRIRRRWLAVRVITSRGLIGEYENTACIAVRQRDGEKPQVIAAGDEALRLGDQDGVTVHDAFNHPRVFVSGVDSTVLVLRHFIREALKGKRLLLRPRTVMHVQEPLACGLTDVETLALRFMAGTANAVIHQGPDTVSDGDVLTLTRQSSTA